MANTTRAVAGSAVKTIAIDSIAFYPSFTVATKARKGDAFAFYPTTASKRKPKRSSKNLSYIQYQKQESVTKLSSKYSRAELDSIFAKSRLEQPATTINQSHLSQTTDSFAFSPCRRPPALNDSTMTRAKDASFGFYPSNGVS